MDPESAHQFVLRWLPYVPQGRPPQGKSIDCMGLTFPNRVGMAAGWDKNGECIDGLARCGFGFIEIGTVTPEAQPGNPQPRLFRLEEHEAIINRMGFNNHGIDALLEKLQRSDHHGIVGVNIGKQRSTAIENALEDYHLCMEKSYLFADYITVNISSPNTPGLRQLQQAGHLHHLIEHLTTLRDALHQQYGKWTPLVVKIAPDQDEESLNALIDVLNASTIDGIIATNTTSQFLQLSTKKGGLSGQPLSKRSTEIISTLKKHLDDRITIIASGGVNSVEDYIAKRRAGATLVQVYTGLVYHGPGLVHDLIKAEEQLN